MSKRMLAFEIGTEEIPSAALYAATEALATSATEALDQARIPHGAVETCSTPRRIILMVADVASESEALVQRAKGPSAQIAFDDEGKPTKAACGFARGKGVDVADLVREADEDGKEYIYAVVEKPAVPTIDLLGSLLVGLISGISWPRSQRWGSGHVTFSRPIRWLVCLLGDEVVPVSYAGLTAGRTTRGHRLIAPQPVEVENAESLLDTLATLHVVASAPERANIIRTQITALEKKTGLRADTPKKTFDEVVNLVEFPTVLMGHFDERFLEVPPEIITDAMLEHQRYFPMYRADGSLDSAFLVVANGDPAYADTICDGNERVVRARLDDAEFFVHEDLRHPLEYYVDGLKRVVFQDKLGSVYAKVARIGTLASAICEGAIITGQTRADAERAALLCKADLITNAVVEFTSLQGIMGGHYALAAGETKATALAITDHYRPRFAGDDLPRNTAGKVVALADKLDTICAIFSIGQGPTGSSDPFALRRAAIGVINILLDGPAVKLAALIDVALDSLAPSVDFDRSAIDKQIEAFFTTRLEVIARDKGYAPDVVQAVTSIGMFEPVETLARIEALSAARSDEPESFDGLATAYTRADHLADVALGTEADPALMGPAESALLAAISAAEQEVGEALAAGDHARAIAALAGLRAPIDAFFEDVLIMDPDEALKNNRLRLLNRFVSVFGNVAAIGQLAK